MRKAVLVAGMLAMVVVGRWTSAQEDMPAGGTDLPSAPPSAETTAQFSYSIGLQVGSTFHKDGVAFDMDSLLAGLKDGMSGAQPKYDTATLDKALEDLGRYRMYLHVTRNREFLEKNKQAEGVQVLPSGLQYKVLASGEGPSPGPTDRVKAHYRGQLIDGTEFDSSYARNEPFVTQVDQVIPGWSEALQKMKVGDKWQLFIPGELAYGEMGAGDIIPPHSTLVFEVELLGIE